MSKLFDTGMLLMTAGVARLAVDDRDFATFCEHCLKRHSRGDWGDLGANDKSSNDKALGTDERLFSVYTSGGWKIWVVTEGDRSATTLLLPEEY